jgi:hypothetical protein
MVLLEAAKFEPDFQDTAFHSVLETYEAHWN